MKRNISFCLVIIAVFIMAGCLTMSNKSNSTGIKRYNIAEHGAIPDGKTLNTKAIQAIIDQCSQNGGGTLFIPKGVFMSGSLFLKQGVNLDFEEGAILRGSQNINDYPKVSTRIEGHFEPWRCALLNAESLDGLKITGKGTLDGNGEPFWKEFYSRRSADPRTTNLNVERPRLTFLNNCKNVKITGITYLNSGFWNLHLYKCQQVIVDNCRFQAPSGRVPDDHAPSSDGIDVDSSQDIEIKNCSFSVGDDDIALKGSKGPFAMQDKDSPAVEHISIHDCVFEAGGGIVTCGSEATRVRDVKVERCVTKGPTVLRLKLRPDTPQQYEDITVNNITIEGNVTILSIAPWTQYFDLKGQPAPTSLVQNIMVSNVKGSGSSLGRISGNPGTTFGKFTLKNINVTLKNANVQAGDFKTAVLDNVIVNGKELH